MKTIGEQIADLRKRKEFTQESLAEELNISPQAISKWENNHSLPDSAILPALARVLCCTIDSILIPDSLLVADAYLTDGFDTIDVTDRVSRLIQSGIFDLTVDKAVLGSDVTDELHLWFLVVKCSDEDGDYFTYAKCGETMRLLKPEARIVETDTLEIVDAYYGNRDAHGNVMTKIRHYEFFERDRYHADAVCFPSHPGTDEKEYLTLVYSNTTGLHVTSCEEQESLVLSDDRTRFLRQNQNDTVILKNIPMLEFDKGMDCTWAGAITLALNHIGENISYEEIMGLSGACYRLAFNYPKWDYSSVDGLVAYDYSTPLYKALGFVREYSARVSKDDRKNERRKILDSLRKTIPVVAINLRIAPEWGVITGFTRNGEDLLCRTYFDARTLNGDDFHGDEERYAEMLEDVGKNEGYLFVDNWPFLISYFDERTEAPDRIDSVLESLRIFVDCVNIERNGGYRMGYRAYETWAASLIEDVPERSMNESDFMRYQSVNHFCMQALVDARRCAAAFLEPAGAYFDDIREKKILAISGVFRRIYLKAQAIYADLSDGYRDRSKVWTKDIREKQAMFLREASTLEKKAEELAVEVISG